MQNNKIQILGVLGGTFFILFFLLSYITSISYSANSCKYEGEIEQCWNENKNKGDPRKFTDFLCEPSQVKEELAIGLILDKKFSELDKEVEEYITLLELEKNIYFGSGAQASYLSAIDEITNKFSVHGEFWQKYNALCTVSTEGSILQEAISCLDGEVAINTGIELFQEDNCKNLAEFKMEISRNIAYKVLVQNKEQILRDAKKEYTQQQREEYSKVLEKVSINWGLIERIASKWPSKTKDRVYGG